MPFKFIVIYDSGSLKYIDVQYINEMDEDFWILLRLSLNSELPEGLYGQKYKRKATISKHNPLIGYFTNETGNILTGLRKFLWIQTHRWWYKTNYWIYLYFLSNLIPIDIEITLGYYNG